MTQGFLFVIVDEMINLQPKIFDILLIFVQ